MAIFRHLAATFKYTCHLEVAVDEVPSALDTSKYETLHSCRSRSSNSSLMLPTPMMGISHILMRIINTMKNKSMTAIEGSSSMSLTQFNNPLQNDVLKETFQKGLLS